MNTPFDEDLSEVDETPRVEAGRPASDQEEGVEDYAFPSPMLCQVLLAPPQPVLNHAPLPVQQLKTTVSLLGGERMEQCQHFLKRICVDASTSVFPVIPPASKGQLLYRIKVDQNPVVALLDHGASHCFMARE